jgi:hypothetical protein
MQGEKMRIHPILLSSILAEALGRGETSLDAARPLGRYVLVGMLPHLVSAHQDARTLKEVFASPKALDAAGLSVDMACWPLGRRGLGALLHRPVRVGRAWSNDVVLPDMRVSHQHAVLEQGEVPTITDLGSSTGTFVNGQQLLAQQPRVLRHADRVSLGGLPLTFLESVRLCGMLLQGNR